LVGEVRLAVRMPPVGEPLRGLLSGWRERHPEVVLTISEMNECEIQSAICQRRWMQRPAWLVVSYRSC
jgi:hypothetical protein